MTNILILSAGTRNKIVQYFVKTLAGKGQVIATDCSDLAPAIYDADKYYIVPRMTDEGYLDVILDICKKEQITGVLSLIDPELSLLADNVDKFADVGTKVIGSSYELCERSLDKFEMYKWLADNNIGGKTITYKLRNWIFARQRYWGEPVPILYDKNGNNIAVDDKDLPVEDAYAFNMKIFEEDRVIVENQKPEYLPLDLSLEAHFPADRSSSMYRKLLRKQGFSPLFAM